MRPPTSGSRRPLSALALLVAGCAAPAGRSTTAWPTPRRRPARLVRPGGDTGLHRTRADRDAGALRPAADGGSQEGLAGQPGGRHPGTPPLVVLVRERTEGRLGSGIASRLGAVDVTKSGRQRGQPATRIAVQLGQFDAVEGSRVDASFTWTVRRTDEGPATGCRLSLSEPVGGGFDALAQGAQRVTSRSWPMPSPASVSAHQGQPGAALRGLT